MVETSKIFPVFCFLFTALPALAFNRVQLGRNLPSEPSFTWDQIALKVGESWVQDGSCPSEACWEISWGHLTLGAQIWQNSIEDNVASGICGQIVYICKIFWACMKIHQRKEGWGSRTNSICSFCILKVGLISKPVFKYTIASIPYYIIITWFSFMKILFVVDLSLFSKAYNAENSQFNKL